MGKLAPTKPKATPVTMPEIKGISIITVISGIPVRTSSSRMPVTSVDPDVSTGHESAEEKVWMPMTRMIISQVSVCFNICKEGLKAEP